MKKLLKLAALMTAVAMIACGCSSGSSTDASAADTTAAETETAAADESGTEAADESEATDETAESEEVTVNYSTGLDDDGNLVDINAEDYVTLPDYTKAELSESDLEVTDDDVQSQIDSLLSSYATTTQVTDREVKDGDTVNIDYVGTIDGVEFDGGNTNGSGTDVTIGETEYIDDFLDQLVGHKPGETFDVNVTFPDPYESNTDLSGKDAVFSTTINYIEETETPEFNDEFVQENLTDIYGYTDAEDAKTKIRESLEESNEYTAVWNWLLDNTTFKEEPQTVIDELLDVYVSTMTQMAESYGITLEDYLSYYGMESEDDLRSYYNDSATEFAHRYLITQAICDKENIVADDAAIEDYFEGTDSSEYITNYGSGYVKMQVKFSLVSDLVMETATIK